MNEDSETTVNTRTMEDYCRLCLRVIQTPSANIFEMEIDEVGEKIFLHQRLQKLFDVKYEQLEWLPKNICYDCLSLTSHFSDYQKDAQERETKLQEYFSHKLKAQWCRENRPGLNGNPGVFVPDDNCVVIEVDPQAEESSEDFSMSDSETEQATQPAADVDTKREPREPPRPTKANVDDSQSNQSFKDDTSSRNESQDSKAPFAGEVVVNLCQYCDMAFTTKLDCAEHERRHDVAAPYVCNFCTFSSASRQVLIYHIKETHDSDRPYVCALCYKNFGRRSDLKKHTIVHTGVRPYTCNACGKSFSRNTNLTKHMRIHRSGKPHVCQHCPRSFGSSGELFRHTTQTHATDQKPAKSASLTEPLQRPNNAPLMKSTPPQRSQPAAIKHNSRSFVCTICSKIFTRERDLQCHLALHQDQLFSCQQCDIAFNRREKLLRHEQDVHGAPRVHDTPRTQPSFGTAAGSNEQSRQAFPTTYLGFYSEANANLS